MESEDAEINHSHVERVSCKWTPAHQHVIEEYVPVQAKVQATIRARRAGKMTRYAATGEAVLVSSVTETTAEEVPTS